MFDIDNKHGPIAEGRTPLHYAISSNSPITVELLLKEYHANPNVVDNENNTTLMCWASINDKNLLILKLLEKYGFDFARLVNQRDSKHGRTAFIILCRKRNSDHCIACFNHLFSICKTIPNCSINILAQTNEGMCGLHYAIIERNVDMLRYLLERVYFPNNDKLNKDGIAIINMQVCRHTSLATLTVRVLEFAEPRQEKSALEMFKLLLSYGMKVDDENIVTMAVESHYTEVADFILNEIWYPTHTFNHIIWLMYEINARHHGSANTAILKSLYNYGFKHGLICNKYHHSKIIMEAAKYNLETFKTTILMILEKHGIDDLKHYKQCDIVNWTKTFETVVESRDSKTDVKSFSQALICHDETKLLKLDADTSNQFVLTCINNHKIDNNSDKKMVHYEQKCSICGDNDDGSQSLSGFECDECKSFICHDCIIVQKIYKKINNNDNDKSLLFAAYNEILHYKNNTKMLNKVKLIKFLIAFFVQYMFMIDLWLFLQFVCDTLIRLPNNVQMQCI